MDGPKENKFLEGLSFARDSLLDHPYVDYARYKNFLAFCNERIKDLEEFKKDNQLDSSDQVEKMFVQQEYHVDEGPEGFEEDSNQVGPKDKKKDKKMKKKTDCAEHDKEMSVPREVAEESSIPLHELAKLSLHGMYKLPEINYEVEKEEWGLSTGYLTSEDLGGRISPVVSFLDFVDKDATMTAYNLMLELNSINGLRAYYRINQTMVAVEKVKTLKFWLQEKDDIWKQGCVNTPTKAS
ncbi:hypothetical protein Dimus_006907 [Dionaea muscipula]